MIAPLPARRTRMRVGVGAAVVLLIVALGVAVLLSAFSSSGTTRTIAASAGNGAPSPSRRTLTVFVHILGAVAKPGLYELHDGDRAVDAIAAAGGFTAKADQQQLNLARFISDGEQIYVAEKGEAQDTPGGSEHAKANGAKVNLNTADADALETLPRVGPAMAARIIAWREANGRFSTVEDLMNITGIGEKTFADLKDLVTV
jgi:competence protein ComEA